MAWCLLFVCLSFDVERVRESLRLCDRVLPRGLSLIPRAGGREKERKGGKREARSFRLFRGFVLFPCFFSSFAVQLFARARLLFLDCCGPSLSFLSFSFFALLPRFSPKSPRRIISKTRNLRARCTRNSNARRFPRF